MLKRDDFCGLLAGKSLLLIKRVREAELAYVQRIIRIAKDESLSRFPTSFSTTLGDDVILQVVAFSSIIGHVYYSFLILGIFDYI